LRTAASRGDDIAEQIRTKSLGELLESGSDYARRNPLLVFGAAAGVGLLLSRFAKSTGQVSYPARARPGQPRQGGARSPAQMRSGQSTGRSQAANL
jgi:hypothetical protein